MVLWKGILQDTMRRCHHASSEDDDIVQSDREDGYQKITHPISKPKYSKTSDFRKGFKYKKQEGDTFEPVKHRAKCKKSLSCSREC